MSLERILKFAVISVLSVSLLPASLVDLGVPSGSLIVGSLANSDLNVAFEPLVPFTVSSAGIYIDPYNASSVIGVQVFSVDSTSPTNPIPRTALTGVASQVVADAGAAFYDIGLSYTFNPGSIYQIAFAGISPLWKPGGNPEYQQYFFSFNNMAFAKPPAYDVLLGGSPLLTVLDGGYGANMNMNVMPWVRFDATVGETAPVPEPATWGMIGLGLAGLALFRRKRGGGNSQRGGESTSG